MNFLEFDKVSKNFSNINVFKNLSFSVAKGERVALLGPGGCGKSTILKMAIGLVKPDEGEVKILGRPIHFLEDEEKKEVLKKVGAAFQNGGLFDFMTVRENILFAMENMTNLEPSEMEERTISMLKEVNLPHALDKIPSELSGGMRRRVGIVRSLISHPQIALLDEPTAGLDPVTSTVVIKMIHQLADKTNSTCVCLTSNVDVAETFADKIFIIREGIIVDAGTAKELKQSKDPWVRSFLMLRSLHSSQDDNHSHGEIRN